MGVLELCDQPAIKLLQFHPQRLGQVFHPERTGRGLDRCLAEQFPQGLREDLGAHRVAVGMHGLQAHGRTDQGVELGDRVLEQRHHMLHQPRGFDGLHHFGVFDQRQVHHLVGACARRTASGAGPGLARQAERRPQFIGILAAPRRLVLEQFPPGVAQFGPL